MAAGVSRGRHWGRRGPGPSYPGSRERFPYLCVPASSEWRWICGGPQAGEWRGPGGAMLFSVRWAAPLFGLIRVAHCALRSAGYVSVCQGSDDYQRLRPEAFARLVLGFSMPIAWPAVADGVAKGATRNMVIRDRFPLTGATWLLMVVAVIVWNPGIGFFNYKSMVGYKCGIGKGGRTRRGGAGWLNHLKRNAAGVVLPFRWFRCGSVAAAKTGVYRSA